LCEKDVMRVYFTPQHHPHRPLPDTATAPLPVVVVGAGPVGLAAALGLARRGVPALVLEAADSVSHGSRAICVSRQSLQILDRLGVGARFAETALPWVRGRSHYRDREVLVFEMPHGERFARPPMVNVSQSVAERILVDAVEAQDGCAVHWQSRVTSVRQEDDLVVLGVETPDGPREVSARWVVAADGARSEVRRALGLRMTGTNYEGRYVIADIHWRNDLPTERLVWFDPPSNPGGSVILHRQPDDIWRVDYQLAAAEDAEAESRPERVHQRVAHHLEWMGNTAPWTLEWSSVYSARALSLDSYTHGRVLFAGDAAHLVPIFGVRGLNSGLEDADDLAWKLTLVASGAADRRLLDTYSEERVDAWRQNIAQADKSTRFMAPNTPGYALTRDAVLSLVADRPALAHLVNPRQSGATHARSSRLTVPATHPADDDGRSGLRPGDPVDDCPVPGAPAGTTLHGLRAGGFGLVGVDLDPASLSTAAARAEAALGGAVPVRPLALRTPADHALVAAVGAVSGELVVIRPDGRILARLDGADPERPAGLMDHVLQGGTR
jgi:3-(3-hydroxy-phenyl)propionate hydroxylase